MIMNIRRMGILDGQGLGNHNFAPLDAPTARYRIGFRLVAGIAFRGCGNCVVKLRSIIGSRLVTPG